MSARHTPGPWQAIGTDPAEGGDWFWIKAQPNAAMRGFTQEIGAVNGSQSDPTQAANARLIAAAPDLLEAAAALVEGEFGLMPDASAFEAAMDRLAAAIAKARGEA
jgi:hypothetical protein